VQPVPVLNLAHCEKLPPHTQWKFFTLATCDHCYLSCCCVSEENLAVSSLLLLQLAPCCTFFSLLQAKQTQRPQLLCIHQTHQHPNLLSGHPPACVPERLSSLWCTNHSLHCDAISQLTFCSHCWCKKYLDQYQPLRNMVPGGLHSRWTSTTLWSSQSITP